MNASRMRGAMAVLLVAVVGLGIAACSRSSSSPAGRLTVEGQADVTRPGEDRREVTGSRSLEVGDRVRVRQGTAVIRLPDDRRLELRLGSDVELQATDRPDRVRPALMGGDLLVVSDGEAFTVAVAQGEVAVQGDARISRGVALLIGVYEGTAQLSSAGSTLTVPALRQAALPATGVFPTRVSTLEYGPSDPWDQRYLSDAIELGNQLEARSQGFTAQLAPSEGRTHGYFRDLVPRLAAEPAFVASLVNPSRAPGETLVGAAIVLEGTRGTFAQRWSAVFAFRDMNASWGLVALEQDVARVPLIETIDAAISRGPTQFAEGPPGRPPSSLLPPANGASATTSIPPRTTSTTTPRSQAARPTTTTVPPATTSTTTATGPLNTGSPLIDDAVNSLVNTLTGLLRSLGGQG